MYNLNTNKIDFSFYEFQVDLILHALELYAYNLHYIGKKSCEDYEQSNIILFYLYNEILSHYSNYNLKNCYNPSRNCRLEIDRIKKKNIYEKKFFQNVS